jgi:hypothetical protein
MKALWSFWTGPLRADTGWASARAWGHPAAANAARCLSLLTVREHFPETILVCDSVDAREVDRLGLDFGEIIVGLDGLANVRPIFWSIGKMIATRMLCERGDPFFHVDGDVFLWKRPPDAWIASPVFAESIYGLDIDWLGFGGFLEAARQTGMPAGWDLSVDRSIALGIYGGSDLDTLDACARIGIELSTDARYAPLWEGREPMASVFSEEVTFSSVCHGRGVSPSVLFQNDRDKWTPGTADRIGYTHLIAWTKKQYGARVLRALAQRSPTMYERCMALAGLEGIEAQP